MHPAMHQIIDLGEGASPIRTPTDLFAFVRRLREGCYDALFIPDRSVKLSLAAWWSRIPVRVGLDSGGRGIGYTVRARITPTERRHEVDIYLDLARLLGLPTEESFPTLSPPDSARQTISQLLNSESLTGQPLIVVHPGGGSNPGMALTTKRYPLPRLAQLVERCATLTNATILVIGGKDDHFLTKGIVELLHRLNVYNWGGQLTLSEIAALAAHPQTQLYIGNDTGATHIAAASGARTFALFGPSDPIRYAPYSPRSAYGWTSGVVSLTGVRGQALVFDWEKEGISVTDALQLAERLLQSR
jgi:ADP-heptose:LPS heptosyltransferase